MKRIYLLLVIHLFTSCNSIIVLEKLQGVSGPYVYGFININGELVIDYKFEGAKRFSKGLAPVKKNGLWGYINTEGNLVIPFQFKEAKPFSQDPAWAPVQENSNSEMNWGYIDTQGNWMVKPQFYNATEFNDGVSEVAKDKYILPGKGVRYDKYFFTKDSKFIYHNGAYPYLSGPGKYSEGLLPVCKEGKWGFKDLSDTWVIPPKYTIVGNFKEGLARVFMASTQTYTDCNWISEEEPIGRWGYIDKTGKIIIPLKFKYAEDFQRGFAVVDEVLSKGMKASDTQYTKYYITTKGEKAFPLQFKEASMFLDSGYALVGNDEKNILKIDPSQRGFIDTKGQKKEFYLEDYARILNVRHGNEGLFRISLEMKPDPQTQFFISRYYNANDLTQSILQDFPPCFSGTYEPPYCMTDNFYEGLSWISKPNQ